MENRTLDGTTVPLVLHRLVDRTIETHEDVPVVHFKGMIDRIGTSWTLLDGASDGATIPGSKRRWLITFDDGNNSDAEMALPILAAAGAKAVFFVVTSWIGKSGCLDWNQVRTLSENGMEIGSHSVSHLNLANAEGNVRRHELRVSRETIEDKVGKPVRAFAFPFGLASAASVRDVHATGYETCCTSRHGLVRLPSSIVPRNSINGRMTWDDVHSTLEASALTRTKWLAEDMAKTTLKIVAGAAGYRAVRRAVFGGTP